MTALTTPDQWQEFSEKNQEFLQTWKDVCDLRKCPMCSERFPDGIINRAPRTSDAKINGAFAFHVFSVHGIAPDDLSVIVANLFSKPLS